jgi:hypothetical protein
VPNTDAFTGWTVTPADDGFHDDFEGADHPWWTETFWTSFNVPERKIGGWFYNQIQKNQGEHGVCNGGAWVWDASDAPALYERSEHGLALPPGPRDLNDIALPNGNVIRTLEPSMKYRVAYSDKGRFEADLLFAGVMEPNPHPAGCAPFWRGRHFDQAMHVTGEIVLHGERIAIDCLSVRDRSWSPRRPHASAASQRVDGGRSAQQLAKPVPQSEWTDVARPPRRPFNIGYIFGTASPRDAFLVYTMVIEGEEARGDFTNTGYLVRDGVWAHLVRGERRCWVDPDKGWIWRVEYDGVDALGRELHAVGEQMSNHGTREGLFHWRWNGVEGWGENQGGIAPSYPRVRRGEPGPR